MNTQSAEEGPNRGNDEFSHSQHTQAENLQDNDLRSSSINATRAENILQMEPPEIISNIQKALEDTARLNITKQQQDENREKYAPLASKVSSADPLAFEEYKSSRFTHWDAIPVWARYGITNHVKSDLLRAWKDLSLGAIEEMLPNKIAFPKLNFDKNTGELPFIIDGLGLSSAVTIKQIEDTLEFITQNDSSNFPNWLSPVASNFLLREIRLKTAHPSPNGGIGLKVTDVCKLEKSLESFEKDRSLNFTPVNPYKLGERARETLFNLVPLLMSAMLVEDLCEQLKVPASNQQKLSIWLSLKGGIPHRRHELVDVLFLLSEVFDEKKLPNEKRLGYTQIYLARGKTKSVKKLGQLIDEEQSGVKLIKKEETGAKQATRINKKTPLELIQEKFTEINTNKEVDSADRESLRRLAALITKGITTLESALKQIEIKVPIDQIRKEAYEAIRKKNDLPSPAHSSTSPSAGSELTNSIDAPKLAPEEKPEVIFSKHGERSQVLDWMEEIKKTSNQLYGPLTEKIEKLRNGERTNCRRIEGVRGETIFELRHSDLRVYFRYLPGRQIQLLLAGKKGEQAEDIDILKNWFS